MTRNKILVLFFTTVVMSVLTLACSSTSNDQVINQSASDTSRCVGASKAQLDMIQGGVSGVDSGNYVKNGWAVKSNDFNDVWMVAAYIYGTGMENGAGPGVWAISGSASSPGMTLAVDGYANSFSDYPDASKTDANIGLYDDGVQEAIDCAENNK